ncbi:MAG TPA: RNA polymerase sigma factor [Chitinophagaceae bacterium]|nr:MAG: ECF RNA polymerase sigma factor SigE [Bacteroidetes bacterium ADurb.BinA245]HMX77579.1 RNA polymerase sigma factor [Chitinophagaceae bacterium]HNA18726.1 RNA polymerase sigma factor [Chitinophagaceae bacterium]HNC39586.1 RNA polymerase sigma factor [Chitinophagaceae bacterium]HNF38157.1 RNA polymerase sigma factor [Chitinophagaceae bacterium]
MIPERNQNITESDLINGCLKDDRRMQEELYRRFSPRMYAVCLRYAGNAEEAQDILQEGFIKVFKKLDSFRSEGSFEGWVRRIFVNTAIEHFRRKKYLMPVTEREENTIEGKYLSVLDNLAAADIMALVQELSPGYRTVFNMYVVEGYSHKEIGDILGISEGTSKSQLSRAKVILQDMVKKYIDKQAGARAKS